MKNKPKKIQKTNKNIKEFLLSEEGKMTKKDIAKIGMGLALVSILTTPTISSAQHNNYFYNPGADGPNGGHVSHSSHGSHGSHGSHASHGNY